MAGRFMKVKRIIIPFITLVIMTSQLAGCATMNSNEMLKSMNESPDVSIEYAIPDEEQQSLDASGVINIDGQQYVSDSDSEGDIGLIDTQQELEEYSYDELIALFKSQYEISRELYNSDTEETIQRELENIGYTADCQGKALPSDYEAQYREWRPSAVQQETQTTETTQQSQNQQSQGQQGQSSKHQGSQTQQPPQQPSQQQQGDSSGDQGSLEGWESFGEVITDTSQISTGTSDPYSGYGEVSIGYGSN